uniref:Syntaphilin b n=1 Tax=Sinocyclocheilus rhinocerous TaxID=307959 RepID=A0A673FW96_9TELE
MSSSSNSGSCKGSDGSPTHRHHIKYTSCNDNHGIRPPPPEQYLTPLQQKEVCIRHLRARLKESIERLQDRDTEIDELRTQLSRMQEDWIEEECHRVEAQLALKEARREIQQLKQVVDVVRSSLGDTDTGVQKCFQDINLQNYKLESLLQSMELVSEGLAESSEGSPARSLTRSSTYTKLSDQTGQEQSGRGASKADLLLEAAFLSQETASVSHPCLSHHHLYLHHLREQGIQTDYDHDPASAPAHGPSTSFNSDLDTIAERTFRSQACSPTSTWMSDEGDDLESTIGSQVTNSVQPQPVTDPLPNPCNSPCSVHPLIETEGEPLAQTTQPRSVLTDAGDEGDHVINIGAEDEDEVDESATSTESMSSGCGLPAKNYWSRHFLVDLLAVVVPVVPTVAWLCRGPHRVGQPMYHIGSLLRGCCTVALHSLRRGGGLRTSNELSPFSTTTTLSEDAR